MKEYQFIISFTDEEIMDIFKEYNPNWEKDSEKYYIDYMIDVMYDYGDKVNEVAYMRLDEGEKKLLYWLEDNYLLVGVDMYAIDEVEIVEF